ncbi:MAG: hypothetical protein ACEQSH_00035 [Bacteroidia bacterium]
MTLYEIVQAAIRDISEHGFDTQKRVQDWVAKIKAAAEREMMPQARLDALLKESLKGIYTRLITEGGVTKMNPGVSRFTIKNVAPRARAELNRRIMMSANLIKLNRENAMADTLRRFEGWASSVPAGGSKVQDKREETANVRKAITSLPFTERRVLIDQGHKLTASINSVVAQDGGAIAAEWNSNVGRTGYDHRPKHLARNGRIFLIRNSWAHEKGFVKPGSDGYTDEIEDVAELPYCSCFYRFLYSLRKLPDDMITQKGRDEQARVRAEMMAS